MSGPGTMPVNAPTLKRKAQPRRHNIITRACVHHDIFCYIDSPYTAFLLHETSASTSQCAPQSVCLARHESPRKGITSPAMLPSPTVVFTIPSVHDDTVLDCRVYHPLHLNPSTVSRVSAPWEKKAAIIAHPYAPLGGLSSQRAEQRSRS